MATICGLGVAGCSWLASSTQDWDALAEPNPTDLVIDSRPPGADVRSSTGATCRTPCTLQIAATGTITLTYTLEGYLPHTISVNSIPAVKSAFLDLTAPKLEPNPVIAELQLAPPPEPPRLVKRQRTRSRDAAAPAAAAPPAPTLLPWPTLR
jgi:hypothetical protein